ncbi:hypothetical protein E2C01_084557 [Portunus trituberculatus]|uniref:Uncharacterized protein n=1 Tax=Portunus trituberculatus TaxID=210409 RepID=A0A5B7J557_PORTR|nr:hypothetical protein [Portunus trituberculatus]
MKPLPGTKGQPDQHGKGGRNANYLEEHRYKPTKILEARTPRPSTKSTPDFANALMSLSNGPSTPH